MAIEQTIKQRLIGAIVLVALAVIFLPSILGQKNERKTFTSKVPQIETTSVDKSKPDNFSDNSAELNSSSSQGSVEANNDASSVSEKATDKVTNKASSDNNVDSGASSESASRQVTDKANSGSATSPSSQEQSGQPGAKSIGSDTTESKDQPSLFTRDSWVIQVGSFSSHANAEILSKRLEEQGMKSFVRPVDLKDKQLLYRVFVGPYLEKQQANDALPKVTDITRLKPIVVKWQPNKH